MMPKVPVFVLLAILLLVFTPLFAGCLSVPGPEDNRKYPVVTLPVTTPPVTKTPVARTPVVTHTPVPAATPAPTAVPYTGTAASGTCVQIGGTVVTPGYSCTGTWLAAADTFSCCSTPPVAETTGSGTTPANVIPASFSLAVNLDDDPGSITP